MDSYQQARLVEDRLDALERMPVGDDQSAREAFAHVMVTVSHINQLAAQARAQTMVGAGELSGGVLEKLEEWLDRLLSGLARIVEKLSNATSFSISVGTGVSVTVDFARSGD